MLPGSCFAFLSLGGKGAQGGLVVLLAYKRTLKMVSGGGFLGGFRAVVFGGFTAFEGCLGHSVGGG